MIKILIFLILGYAVILLLFYVSQRKLIYFPDQLTSDSIHAPLVHMREMTLDTEDGLHLMAWYKPSQINLPTIVYFHGNAGNISHRAFVVKPFLDEGLGVLLVTYRGYSNNPGHPDEEGLYKDARAAIHFLLQQRIPLSCIVLYGESIGSAVAIQMATEFNVGGIILQSPFTSLGELGQFHYPFFPVNWLVKDKFDSLAKAKLIKSPTFLLYGLRDDIVPPQFSLKLFEAIEASKKKMPFEKIGHNDSYDAGFAIQFIKEYVKCKNGD